MEQAIQQIETMISGYLDTDSLSEKIERINLLREIIHSRSPFKNEPVDFVRWVLSGEVIANDYNPNRVAPPEMKLLEVSIVNDGYTQPIVTFPRDGIHEVVDGFHRNRIGKESKIVRQRIQGYLPTVAIRTEHQSKEDRIASTIRHNRARGKHVVDGMSEIVLELKNRNWKNDRIARELGMDEDEILRLCQITGLESLFRDDDFSRSWNIEDSEEDAEEIVDTVTEEEKQMNLWRSINTDDPDRFFHTYDKWECFKAGFYATTKDGMTKEECELRYPKLMADEDAFRAALQGVIDEWKHSCEHYLTNRAMNRIAWLGQAAVCYTSGVPSIFRAGFYRLSVEQQERANEIALEYLNQWLERHNLDVVSIDEGLATGRQVDIY
jgi:ParB-like chromosome segregation protein Spo0J